MDTERNNSNAIITRKIRREIQTALKGIGASQKDVKRIPTLTANALDDLAEKLDADAYLRAYIGSWGDTLEDEEILRCLQQWNSRSKAERS